MNASFRAAKEQILGPKAVLTHLQRTMRLYRQALETSSSWAADRQVWLEKAAEIRAEFEKTKALGLHPKSKAAEAKLLAGEAKLAEFFHPDSYTLCYMPGGTKFMRNPPPPYDIVYGGEENIPDDARTPVSQPVDIFKQPVPKGRERNQRVFVDFMSKEGIVEN